MAPTGPAKRTAPYDDILTELQTLRDNLAHVHSTMRHLDERSLRNEKLLMQMQLDLRRNSKLLEGIAAALKPTKSA